MFYCKDVKYDMCELKKIIRKIKYAKNLNDLICFLNGSNSHFLSLSAEIITCGHFIAKHLASWENVAFKCELTCHYLHTQS